MTIVTRISRLEDEPRAILVSGLTLPPFRGTLVLALAVVATAYAAGDLTPQQLRGKQLYLTGESAAKRKVSATLGNDETEILAGVVPCASCHGRNGRGKPEGGVRPANLQWDVLTHATTGDRGRAAYTRSRLKRAVTMGIDASNHKLDPAMPHYRMTIVDLDDLLAYLEKLGTERDPGVGDAALRIGVILPPAAQERDAVRNTIAGYFEGVNRSGGIYGRRLDPVFSESGGTAAERASALQSFVEREQPFALTASHFAGADEAMSAAADKLSVPAIAAFSARAGEGRHVFQLLGGVHEQALALFAAAGGEGNAFIVADDASRDAAKSIRDNLAAWKIEIVSTLPPSLDSRAVLFLGPPQSLAPTLAACASASSPPFVLIPAAYAGGDLTLAPAALSRRILVALPSSPGDVTPAGREELHALHADAAHATACRLALASAKLLVEALRRTGRDVDRESLVDTLEGFYRVTTDLTPPITWSPNQRAGTRGALVAALDLETKQWIDRGWWGE